VGADVARISQIEVEPHLRPDVERVERGSGSVYLARSGSVAVGVFAPAGFPAVDRSALSSALKRCIDVAGALAGIVLTAPLMLAAAAAIKLQSRGPILFRQVRVGRGGKTFAMWKLRTMCVDAEARKSQLTNQNEMSGPVFKIASDPRITGVGCMLRKYSIDELPQFFHVLTGQMSLVGPRPPLPGEVEFYKPWQRGRLAVKPGLTCLWQVNGRNNVDFDEWVNLDLEYIRRWSLALDLRILLKTIPVVLRGSGV